MTRFRDFIRLIYPAIRIAVMIGFLPILAVVYLLRPFREIKIWHMPAENMGALSGDCDLFSRRFKAGVFSRKRQIWLVFASVSANDELLRMWHRTIPFVRSLFLARVYFLLRPLLERAQLCNANYVSSWDYLEPNIYPPALAFSLDEEREGRRQLAKMGLGEQDWFVPFHVREQSYFLKVMPPKAIEYHLREGLPSSYRDATIENYFLAAEYIVERGGFAVRTGAHVARPIATQNPKIVDYATRFRSEFMDIYLFGNARFFLTCETGVINTASIFNVPVAAANMTWMGLPPLRSSDLCIYKMWRWAGEGRFLTFPELEQIGLFDYHHFQGGKRHHIPVAKLGLEAVENTPEDVLDLCRDMFDKLDGIQPSAEARELQQIWRRRYMDHLDGTPYSQHAGWIGPRFVLKHQQLIAP